MLKRKLLKSLLSQLLTLLPSRIEIMPKLQNGHFKPKHIRFGADIQIDAKMKKAIEKRRRKKKINRRRK